MAAEADQDAINQNKKADPTKLDLLFYWGLYY
jgi:hypothetical protein